MGQSNHETTKTDPLSADRVPNRFSNADHDRVWITNVSSSIGQDNGFNMVNQGVPEMQGSHGSIESSWCSSQPRIKNDTWNTMSFRPFVWSVEQDISFELLAFVVYGCSKLNHGLILWFLFLKQSYTWTHICTVHCRNHLPPCIGFPKPSRYFFVYVHMHKIFDANMIQYQCVHPHSATFGLSRSWLTWGMPAEAQVLFTAADWTGEGPNGPANKRLDSYQRLSPFKCFNFRRIVYYDMSHGLGCLKCTVWTIHKCLCLIDSPFGMIAIPGPTWINWSDVLEG